MDDPLRARLHHAHHRAVVGHRCLRRGGAHSPDGFKKTYGFVIGAVFSGVIGVGFYPLMGSRVWCRFGCPQAAILGFIQRYFSRFRITTNGGQCMSCGNCSTYCEMGNRRSSIRAATGEHRALVVRGGAGCAPPSVRAAFSSSRTARPIPIATPGPTPRARSWPEASGSSPERSRHARRGCPTDRRGHRRTYGPRS